MVINPNDTQELYFYNNPIGGIEVIKVNASKTSERIPDTTFEIRRMDDALVDTITTDKNGRAYLPLEDGSYYAIEVEANPDFVLDDTPHYFEVKNGEVTTLRIKNEANSGILIHKVDTSGEGIYGVKFLLYDEDRNPIGEFTSDDNPLRIGRIKGKRRRKAPRRPRCGQLQHPTAFSASIRGWGGYAAWRRVRSGWPRPRSVWNAPGE